MRLEVDQSGKIEEPGSTILAAANDVQYAIEIPGRVKQAARQRLQEQGRGKKDALLSVFAAGLFLLLREQLATGANVLIDVEYTGHEGAVKGLLLDFVRKAGFRQDRLRISFGLVGKRSPAHVRAWNVRRGKVRANERVTLAQLMAVLK